MLLRISQLRGGEVLRIDNASIMPVIPRANTHLTAVMIAEKAASFLIR
jgi:choline dehydrogenase-like flavoprotein